jgi:hypothetical protein
LVAKVDSAAVRDGFDLYLRGFFVTNDGKWTVVQQGMNGDKRQARRYHWYSEGLSSFVQEPHSAIDGPGQGNIINLTDRRAAHSRGAQLELISDLGPDRIIQEYAALTAAPALQPDLPHLVMPAHHDVRASNVFIRRLHGTLAAATDRRPAEFADLLLTPGVGAGTVESPCDGCRGGARRAAPLRRPRRFSLAHGGKDRHPYSVTLKVYGETIWIIKSAVQKARLGQAEEMQALRRLDDQARLLERTATGPSLDVFIAGERSRSPSFDGRSVFGWEKDVAECVDRRSATDPVKMGTGAVVDVRLPRIAIAGWVHNRSDTLVPQQPPQGLGVPDRVAIIGVVEVGPDALRVCCPDAVGPDFELVARIVMAIPPLGAMEADVDVGCGDHELVGQTRTAAGAKDDARVAECFVDAAIPPALVPELYDVPVPRPELGYEAVELGAGVFEARRELEEEASHGGTEKIGDEPKILDELSGAREPACMGNEFVRFDAVDEAPAANLLAPLLDGGDRRP